MDGGGSLNIRAWRCLSDNRRYALKFGEHLEPARQAMADLAAAYEPADLYRRGFKLYEMFRPGVPAGESGWGAKGGSLGSSSPSPI